MVSFLRMAGILVSGLCLFQAALASPSDWSVGFAGTGPLKIGMAANDVSRVLGEALEKPLVAGADPTGECWQVTPANAGALTLMFLHGVLARIDVHSAGPRTDAGIEVGQDESLIFKAYGHRVRLARHADADDGRYLTVEDAKAGRAIRFESVAQRIVTYYVGTAETVRFTEGCA